MSYYQVTNVRGLLCYEMSLTTATTDQNITMAGKIIMVILSTKNLQWYYYYYYAYTDI